MLTLGTLQFKLNTIPGMLHQRALEFPDTPCYLFPERGQTCTWRSLWQEVKAVAVGLRQLGIQRGDRIAILMEGCAEQLICIYAAIAAGGVAVPLSTYLTKEELRGCLLEARPAVFIIGSAEQHIAYTQLQGVVADRPGTEALSDTHWIPHHAFVLGSAVDSSSFFRNYKTLKSEPKPEYRPAIDSLPVTVHTPAFLLFSSGTTGKPKGILRSAASFMAKKPTDEIVKAPAFLSFFARKGNVYVNRFAGLSLLPLYHLAGIGILLTPLQVCNIRLAMLTRFNPVRALQSIAQTKARFLMGTPHMLQAMMALEPATTQLESVLGIIFASAAVRPHVVKQAIQSCKNLYFFSVSYGSTETGAVANGTCFLPNNRHVAVSLLLRVMRRLNYLDGEIALEAFFQTTASIGGKVARQVEVGILSPHTGAWLPVGQEGEILVRSHRIMPYQHTGTMDAQQEEGWFKTGDLGYVDARNCIMITDRLKHIISRGGEKISPAEIEKIMQQQPGIEEAVVVGVPDVLYGEVIGAAFTEKTGGAVSIEVLRETLQASLSSFKVPQYFLRLSALPLNANGKIAVAEVRSELQHMIQVQHA
ncbi:long-chain fatty acid--CoA ligase [Hymenobacter sediminis]|uniref:class I adenylate-forming enzyme family protein n=1 Tax=Hymenobacter sediminis TaxID=2218621 RepID=UPI000DA6A910|nr:class I adenylate-forming enzyme family protein [Hymenobacter sediminis]RPD45837.1 long-chain fatty acid--CoA ligase [Hymenobacter sediminis]